MRIITGKIKGRPLHNPKDQHFRPTKNRVREAVFDIIQSWIQGATVLDLFCGTGSLGLEALSRGASHVTFVDLSVTYLKKNVRPNDENISIIQSSAIPWLKKCHRVFDLIFLDPPWDREDLYEASLKQVLEFDILDPEGTVVCEHFKEMSLPKLGTQGKRYFYGKSTITLIKK